MIEFPPGFFDRTDDAADDAFYSWPRLVTHIDDRAIAAVGALYEELGIDGDVLDLMSSWTSHFRRAPTTLTVLGMNAAELAANTHAANAVVHDLNTDPRLPFHDESFDAAVCCVSVDYLVRPIEVFCDVSRRAPWWGVRVHVLESMLPHQGDTRLAGDDRSGALRHRVRILPALGWVGTNRSQRCARPPRGGETPSMAFGAGAGRLFVS